MSSQVALISLGCDKNRVDAEIMLGYLEESGYRLTSHLDEAEIIIINTCGFITDAKEESIAAILEAADYKKNGRCRHLIVSGCLAQRYGQELLEEIEEIDGVVGTGAVDEIVAVLNRLGCESKINLINEPGFLHTHGAPRRLTTPGYTAYLKIAEGCNNHCSYCAIPAMRGGYRSRTIEDIVAEAKTLCQHGVKELILVAQDTTRYGLDLYGHYALTDLLLQLVQIKQCQWIRLLYCYPDAITPRLLELMAASPKICNYLDLPLQHINRRILGLMHRRGDKSKINDLMATIRNTVPGVVLRTTFIVGFPGETQQEFEELLDFMQQVRFERAGVFGYCAEEGTKAANLPDQLEAIVIAERKQKAMELQQQIALSYHQSLLGQNITVLVEGWDSDTHLYWGRSFADAPDVDGKVFFATRSQQLQGGDLIKVRILDASAYDLSGEHII